MKFLTSIWSAVIGALILTLVMFFFLMNNAMKVIKDEHQHHLAASIPAAPEKPINYPDDLDENIKSFIKELEDRDARIRAREESLAGMLNSIKQEKKELESRQQQISDLKDDFGKKVKEHQARLIFLNKQEQDQMKDLAATVEALSPSAAVALFMQMNAKKDAEDPTGTNTLQPNSKIIAILDLMSPRDIAPIFEEMTGGKEATEESKSLAAALTQHLTRLVVEDNGDSKQNPGG